MSIKQRVCVIENSVPYKYEVEYESPVTFSGLKDVLSKVGCKVNFNKKRVIMHAQSIGEVEVLDSTSISPDDVSLRLHVYVENVKSGETRKELETKIKGFVSGSADARKHFAGYSKKNITELVNLISTWEEASKKNKAVRKEKPVVTKPVANPGKELSNKELLEEYKRSKPQNCK
jgi:hypothetical protein